MSLEQDQVPQEQARLTEYASQLMDRVSILAGHVAILNEQGLGSYDIYEVIRRELCDLNDELLDLPDVDYCYSGPGLGPILLPDGDEHTAYSFITNGKGRFNELVLTDAATMSYVTAEDIDAQLGDEDEGDLMDVEDREAIQEFKKTLLNPPVGQALYVEMLLADCDGADAVLAGQSVRAKQYGVYHILDACNFQLEYIVVDQEEPSDLVEIHDLATTISAESDALRTLMKSASFRSLSCASQIRKLEHDISALNEVLKLDRTFVVTNPAEIYVPNVADENHRMINVKLSSEVGGFEMNAIRVDSLEVFRLGNGQRIQHNSNMVDPEAGLCLIGEVDEHTMAMLEIASPVVCVPVSSQDFKCMFFPTDQQ